MQVTGCYKTLWSPGRQTAWCYHRCDTYTCHSEPQISLHALCTSVMSLSVRKYKTSAGSKVTLLRLSHYKHWASSLQRVCPASCKACGFQRKHEWRVGCASYTATDLNTFDSYLLLRGAYTEYVIHLILICLGGALTEYVIHLILICWVGAHWQYVNNPYS